MSNATGSKAIGYIRVSTAKQAESGLGADAQRDAIERWAKQQGIAIEAVHADEGVSGSTDALDRDGLLDAIGDLQRGDTLVEIVPNRWAHRRCAWPAGLPFGQPGGDAARQRNA